MPFVRKRGDLILSTEDSTKLQAISKSGKEPFERVRRAKILLSYSKNKSINSISKTVGVCRPTVEKCVDKALIGGIEMVLTDLKRKGGQSSITADSKIWVINLACTKPKDHGYASELNQKKNCKVEF